MKILFVTLCPIEINTSAMIRNNALIYGLLDSNQQVDILTISTNIENSVSENRFENNKNVNVITLESNKKYNRLVENKSNLIGSLKKRVIPIVRYIYHSFNLFDNTIFVAKEVKSNILKEKFYDVIISSSDPKSSHVIVENLVKHGLKYGKWIQYWGDPLTLDITKKSLHSRSYVKKTESQLFSFADKIVYVSPITLLEQKKMFPDFAEKMHFIPIPYLKKRVYINKPVGKTKIGYFGDYHSKIRNIKPLYEACKRLIDNFEAQFVGNSDLSLCELKNISIIPRVSQRKLEDFEANCDIFVCILNNSGTQIPGKLYHYAATNKPVLVILDGDKKDQIKEYLEKYDRFILCNNKEEDIIDALNNIKESERVFYPSKLLEPQIVAKQFLELVNH